MIGNSESEVSEDDFSLSEMTADDVSWGVELMHKDCAKLQFLREFTENGIQAIEESGGAGGVLWTYDDNWHEKNGSYKATIIDNGVGMTGREIAQYINKIFSSGKTLGLNKNYGIGAKIAAAPLNPRGIEYWTWKDGKGYLAVLRMKAGKYGLQKFENDRGGMDDWMEDISDNYKPNEIDKHGVKVVLLGESDAENTYFNENADIPSRWILRYLNSRYFSISEGIKLRAPSHRKNSDGSVTRVRRRVLGMKKFFDNHVEEENHSGQIEVYKGTLHWWLLDSPENRNHYTDFTYHSQSGVVFQNEIYDLATMQKHRSRMQKFNLLYTYNRVAIMIEPHFKARSNTARSHLLMEDESGLPWGKWASEFAHQMPEVIRDMEAEMFAKSVQDVDKEIRDRIRKWFDAQPLSRFEQSDEGLEEIDDPDVFKNDGGSGSEGDSPPDNPPEPKEPSKPRNPYSDFIEPKDKRAERKDVKDPTPDVVWKTIEDGTRNEGELEDRAAEYLPGKDVLIINGDFRVFQDLLKRLQNEKGNADIGRERTIEKYVIREYKFTLIESIMKTKLLNDNPHWSRSQVEEKCLSPEGLTEAVMANYHLWFMLNQNIGRWMSAVKQDEGTGTQNDAVTA